MRIPPDILSLWLEKLRDTKLERRESWRLFDDHRANFLRTRNELTGQFHYNPLGLLLRTEPFKQQGRFELEERNWEEESVWYFRGDRYVQSRSGVTLREGRRPNFGSVCPNQLRKNGFIFNPYSEFTSLMSLIHGRTSKGYLSFGAFADTLVSIAGTRKKELVNHSNPLLTF